MQRPETDFFSWNKKFKSENSCVNHLIKLRWPNGFVCPHCEHNHGYYNKDRKVFECSNCHKQTSVTSNTVFHKSKVPLLKWNWAIFHMSSDKGSISALRLSKLIEVNWKTAYLMLRKLRKAMGDKDSQYTLSGIIELDDAFVGGKKTGKRGRGSAGKVSVLVACENNNGCPGYVAMKVIDSVSINEISNFTKEKIKKNSIVRTDAYPSNNGVAEYAILEKKVTPSDQVDKWLPWVHVVISNLKRFILGSFHGTSNQYLQDYLDEFSYRFNRRKWEKQIPNRLLSLCLSHGRVSIV